MLSISCSEQWDDAFLTNAVNAKSKIKLQRFNFSLNKNSLLILILDFQLVYKFSRFILDKSWKKYCLSILFNKFEAKIRIHSVTELIS